MSSKDLKFNSVFRRDSNPTADSNAPKSLNSGADGILNG